MINTKNLKCWFISLCVVSIILSTISLLFSLRIYYSNDQYNLWYFENIRQSWIAPPIYSISLSSTPCSNSNSELINQEWELTFEGCGYDFFQNCRYFTERISSLALADPSDFINNLNLTKWKSKHYCVKRLNNYNYFNMTLAEKNGNCPNNYKKCGVVDSLENTLCVLSSESCPRTIGDLKQSIGFNLNFTSELDTENVMNDLTINGKNYNNHLITQTLIRRNPVCYSYATAMRDTVQKPFFRFDFQHECSYINGTYFDPRFMLLDYSDIMQVYEENAVFSKLQEKSAIVVQEISNISKNVFGFLFAKNYPGVKLSCLQKKSEANNSNFLFSEKDLKKIQSVQAFLFCEFLSILFNAVFIVIEIVIFKFNWFRPRENKDDLIDLKYKLNSYRLVKMSVAVGYFFLVFVTTLISSVYYYRLSESIYDITNLFGNSDCVDPYTYSLLEFTCKALFIKRNNYSGPLIFAAAYLLVYLISILFSKRTIEKLSKEYNELRSIDKKNDLEVRNEKDLGPR